MSEARQYLKARWGTPNARPVITHVYSVREGWSRLKSRDKLSPELAALYRTQGFVMVRARFRFHSADVTLSNYLSAFAPATTRTPVYRGPRFQPPTPPVRD